MKMCSECRRELQPEAFYANKNKPDGLDRRCKECFKQYKKELRDWDPEAARAREREKIRRQMERDPEGFKAKNREKSRRYADKDRAAYNARMRKWQQDHRTPERGVWNAMKQRCLNPKTINYADYGGRGISVCERWMLFANFLTDMGPKPGPKYTIERIDNYGNYEPGNCKWATRAEQMRNTRNNRVIAAFGRTQCLTDWESETGIDRHIIAQRLARGYAPETVLAVRGGKHLTAKRAPSSS